MPFVFVGFLWIFTILFISLNSRRNSIKLIGIYLSTTILALTIFEGYLWFKSGSFYIDNKTSPDYYYIYDKILGYAPMKGEKIIGTEFYKNKLIFNVTYTIDQNGFRITPSHNNSDVQGCVLFFGCSFTYGLGVNDSETVPYQVSIKSKGRYCIYNLGFIGYGPHQMLSELEHNRIRNKIENKGKIYAVYQAIPDHINRVAGLRHWDYLGPRYVLDRNGEVRLTGNFSNNNLFPKIIVKYLNKSLFYRDYIGGKRFTNSDKDVNLFTSIVYTAKKKFEKLYSDSEFHVIFWDSDFRRDQSLEILKYFKDKGIIVHLISNILPDYQHNRIKYILNTYDIHPNALSYKLLAEYITSNILQE